MGQQDLEDITGENPENEKKLVNHTVARLRSFIERIERLEEARRDLADDIKDIKSEAKNAGFDVKAINQILRERRMEPTEAEDLLSQLEVYRAALGMLNGTPLSERARRRWSPPEEFEPASPPPEPPKSGKEAPAPSSAPENPAAPTQNVPNAEDIAAAREQGSADHRAGAKVTANPWPFGDLRRAAWDEGWCAAAGTDGMEIPDAWRRKPKKDAPPKTGGDE